MIQMMTDKKERRGWFTFDMLQTLDWLLLEVSLVFAIRYVPGWKNETLLFIITGLAIIPLAGWMGRATELLGARGLWHRRAAQCHLWQRRRVDYRVDGFIA